MRIAQETLRFHSVVGSFVVWRGVLVVAGVGEDLFDHGADVVVL
jgi:hypothetical protein